MTMNWSIGNKIAALVRIASQTDKEGYAPFPSSMLDNMRNWQREGLIEIIKYGTAARIIKYGTAARITEAGRKLAKKTMK